MRSGEKERDRMERTTLRTLAHTLAGAEEGGNSAQKQRENLLFIGAPGYLTADPDT